MLLFDKKVLTLHPYLRNNSNKIKKDLKIMMTIFTMAVAAVMFSGMVLCMGMFLRDVINSIPEMTNMSHSVSLSK